MNRMVDNYIMNKLHFVDLPNVGVLVDDLNPFLFQRIKKDIERVREDVIKNSTETSKDLLRTFQKKLAGYSYDESLAPDVMRDINKEVIRLIGVYEDKYGYFERMFNSVFNIVDLDTQLDLERMWVNIQRKGEFLPLHRHSGLYSFCIWVDVPFDMKHEHENIPNVELIKNRSGMFEFVYTDCLGKIKSYGLPVDRSWEGKICVFPADLHHTVYPFYSSDGIRISIAGNYRLSMSKEKDEN